GSKIRLTAEARDRAVAVSLSDGERSYSAPIAPVGNTSPGGVGLLDRKDRSGQSFENFEVRRSPTLIEDGHLERKLYDASGAYRGELAGPGWDDFGKTKIILLDSYQPERLPFPQDWVLVLEKRK